MARLSNWKGQPVAERMIAYFKRDQADVCGAVYLSGVRRCMADIWYLSLKEQV